MKKYLLVVIGNFESDDTCKEIALTLTPIVDSPNLKFNITNTCLIFHFASEVSQEEITDYLTGGITGTVNGFILTECNDKVSVNFPENITKHLFDLENEGENVELRLNAQSEQNNDDTKVDDTLLALLLEEIKQNVKFPSLDTILEKINEKGLQSLTQFEKDTLEYYSKN